MSPSVCPSVTCRYSVETVQYILKLFSPSGSHTILVFFPVGLPNSDNIPTLGRRMHVGYEKIAIFDQYLALVYLRNNTR